MTTKEQRIQNLLTLIPLTVDELTEIKEELRAMNEELVTLTGMNFHMHALIKQTKAMKENLS